MSKVGANQATNWLRLLLPLGVAIYFRIPVLFAIVAGCALLLLCLQRKHSYRDTTCTPISVDDLPRRARRYFEQYTFEFEQCGFVALGDFLVEKWLGPSHKRYFLHRSLPIFAEIYDNARAPRRNSFCMASVAENGTVIESSRYSGAGIPEIANVHFVFAKGESPRGMLEQHLSALSDYEDSGLRMLPLEADDLEEFMRYETRLSYTHFHERGLVGSPPWLDDLRLRQAADRRVPEEVGA